MDTDQNTLERLMKMKRSRINRSVLYFANEKGKRDFISKNNFNIKKTK